MFAVLSNISLLSMRQECSVAVSKSMFPIHLERSPMWSIEHQTHLWWVRQGTGHVVHRFLPRALVIYLITRGSFGIGITLFWISSARLDSLRWSCLIVLKPIIAIHELTRNTQQNVFSHLYTFVWMKPRLWKKNTFKNWLMQESNIDSTRK